MRLFVGVPVPASPVYLQVVRDLLDDVDARPVPTGTWHVTLRFLGDLPDPAPAQAALDDALSGQAPIPAVVAGVGAFQDPRRARIVWAGVEAPGIEAVAADVVAATEALGQPPDKRRFRAHVTLARLRRPRDLTGFVARHADTRFAEGPLDRVVLYRSVLGPDGPSYSGVHEWRLA